MKTNEFHMELWKKIFLVGMIPVLTIVILVSISSFNRASEVTVTQSQKALSDQIKRIDLSINTHVNQIENSLDNATAILGARYTEVPDIDDDEENEFINDCAKTIQKTYSEVTAIVILWEDGSIYSTDSTRTINTDGVDIMTAQVEENPHTCFWARGTVNLFDSSYSLLAYKPIYNKNKEYLGIMAIEISNRKMAANLMVVQRINSDQTTFFMDKTGIRIYSDNYLSYDLQDAAIAAYENGTRHGYITAGGESYYVYMQYSATAGWITSATIPEKELSSPVDKLRGYIIGMVIVCIIVAAVFVYVLARKIIAPLKRLNETMQKVQANDLDVYVENRSNDETRELTDSFNYMIKRLRELINRIYVEELARKNAEMEALQAQINPHFLYNTLDSINWMLISRGENDISEVVVALGELMRYSVNTVSSVVTVKQEYDNIHNYLLLQKTRLEEKLNYNLVLDPEVEAYPMPRLTLQPFVENAILHGIVPGDRPGMLWVSTTNTSEGVVIEIKDNGVGIDHDKLKKIQENCRDMGENNIGLQNVYKRIYLQYGEKATVEVESIESCGTLIRLILPPIEGGSNEDSNN